MNYRAISLIQPWAWLVLHGGKDLENRSWRWTGALPLRVLLHASKTYNEREFENAFDIAHDINPELVVPPPEDWKAIGLGGFVGAVTVERVVALALDSPDTLSPWANTAGHGYVLSKPTAIEFFPFRGQQGFFEVPERTVQEIHRRGRPGG